MYYIGQGVPQSFAEALHWCRTAVCQGDVYSQLNVGLMYEKGEGVPLDYVQAYMWLNFAAANLRASDSETRAQAVANRDLAARKLSPDQIAQAQAQAGEFAFFNGPDPFVQPPRCN
jgi:hypothetical protein